MLIEAEQREAPARRPEWLQVAISAIVLMSSVVNFAVSAWTQKTVAEIKLDLMHELQRQAERYDALYTRRDAIDAITKRLDRLEAAR